MVVSVSDLSLTGFRMNCYTRLNHDYPVFLTLPTFASLEGKIRWNNGDLYGCQFVNSLYPAVLEHIVARFPTLGR